MSEPNAPTWFYDLNRDERFDSPAFLRQPVRGVTETRAAEVDERIEAVIRKYRECMK